MRAAAVALFLLLFGILASESVLARKGFGQSGPVASGRVQSGGQPRPQASGHHRHGHHHHHHKSFVGVGVGFGYGYPWGWWPPPYYYPYPVVYPAQPVTYIEQGGAPAAVEPARWWYYCESSTSYYPYVRECPDGWERMPVAPE